jgi:hypothetical protein
MKAKKKINKKKFKKKIDEFEEYKVNRTREKIGNKRRKRLE